MLQNAGKTNRQVRRTCMWIFEALMLLLDEKPYNKIGISDITKKAGIARQTFYRNYKSKDDIVSEHLINTINLELVKTGGGKDRKNDVVLSFNLNYMTENKDTIKKMLSIVDIEHRIRSEAKEYPLVLLEHYKKKLSPKEYLKCRYKLYYQLIGCLQVFFDWFLDDMPLPVSEILSFLNSMNIPKTIHSTIPNLVVHIK